MLLDDIQCDFSQATAQLKSHVRKSFVPAVFAAVCLVSGCRKAPSEPAQEMQKVTCSDITVFRDQDVDVTGACTYESGKEVDAAYVSADTSTVNTKRNGTYSMVVTISDKSGNMTLHDVSVTVKEPEVTTPSIEPLCEKPYVRKPVSTPEPTPEATPKPTPEATPEPTPTPTPEATSTPRPTATPEATQSAKKAEEIRQQIIRCERASGLWNGKQCIYPILE